MHYFRSINQVQIRTLARSVSQELYRIRKFLQKLPVISNLYNDGKNKIRNRNRLRAIKAEGDALHHWFRSSAAGTRCCITAVTRKVQLTSSTGHWPLHLVAQRTASIHRAKCTSYNLTDTSHLSGTVTADSAQGAYIFFVNFLFLPSIKHTSSYDWIITIR
jgi:hypothetical protein